MTTGSVLAAYPDLNVEILHDASPARERCEQELLEAGHVMPLMHRCAWTRTVRPGGDWFVCARDETDRCAYGLALEVNRSRAVPGYLLIRCQRIGGSSVAGAAEAALAAVTRLAKAHPRVLRVDLEVFSRDDAVRATLARVLAAQGCRPKPEPRGYAETIVMDLLPDEEEIFAALASKTRRDIKAAAKAGAFTRAITHPAPADRLNALLKETMGRTGGQFHAPDWNGIITLGQSHPTLARLTGLYRSDLEGPEALVAFAWGCGHGDHAQYSLAASTRTSGLRIPLAYALAWDLICWAKRNGARWFDFGGVTRGTLGSGDPVGGISDFKRYFSQRMERVADEWLLEPRRLAAKVAATVGLGRAWFERLGRPLG